jgi:NADH-quinone oxidoreductase subunit N
VTTQALAFNLMPIVPEILVLATALVVLVVGLFLRKGRGHQTGHGLSWLAWLALAGVLGAAAATYYLWDGLADPALQDMLVADGYAMFLNLVILAAAALAILFSVEYVRRTGLAQGEYYTLLLLSTGGMMLMAGAINLVTIFLALEILSIALYILVGLNRAEQRSAEAALKYLLLGAFASAFLLYGMALVYGQTGTTSLAGIREIIRSQNAQSPALLLVGLGLMIAGFGFKVSLVPFHLWTPDVYVGAPTSVTAFMSVGAKVAGFAALGRVALYAFGGLRGDWQWVLAGLAALTMTVGNLAALRQTNIKRMLAYSGIAQAGYILTGLAAGNELGTAGALFYLFAYAFTNVAAFAVVIAVARWYEGSHGGLPPHQGESLEAYAGLAEKKPGLAVAMSVFMLSLTGLPPLAGFVGKLYVFGGAVQGGLTWLAIVGVINSVVSAYYYLRIVVEMAGKGARSGDRPQPGVVCPALKVGLAVAGVATLALGLWPAPILNWARIAVAALLGG